MGFKLNFNWNFPGPPQPHPALTDWHGDAVAFRIQQTADLRQLAVPFRDVLQWGGLHQECIEALALLHALHALIVALREHRWPS